MLLRDLLNKDKLYCWNQRQELGACSKY